MGVFPFPMPFSGPPKFGSFSPLALFAASEPGGWYDPSDLTTLFQDAAGTTPVTAVEQPVGLVLDKGKGLVLGSELVTNGDFSSSTGWTVAGSATISSGRLNLNAASDGAYYAISGLVAGRTYVVFLQHNNVPSNNGGASVSFQSTTGYTATAYKFSGTGTTTLRVVAEASPQYFKIYAPNVGTYSSTWVDNISVRELPGNHLSQSTSTARPVLSARVNLLTRTEQFDNAAWALLNSTISPDAVASPTGTMTADKLRETNASNAFHQVYQQTASTLQAGSVTFSFYAKAEERDTGTVLLANKATTNFVFASFALSGAGSVGAIQTLGSGWSSGTISIGSVGNGWYRIVLSATYAAADQLIAVVEITNAGTRQYTGTTNFGFYIWGADLRPANAGVGLPAYQRVGAATSGTSSAAGNSDYDTTGFPLYLKFDGTDDFLVSGTINPGSVDKAQVFAGVRKLSDAAASLVAELSVSGTANSGSFSMLAPSSAAANYFFRSRGDGTIEGAIATTYTAPITNVIAGFGDISGDAMRLNVNGVEAATNLVNDQGAGNYGSYPLYVGRRGGSTLPFNGHLYSLIFRFSATNLDAATITATETWVNQKTLAY